MVGDQSKTSSIDEPKNPRLLGEIKVDPAEKAPLGGLNPYSKHFDNIGGHFFQLLVEHARLTKNKRVLDVGCGTGRLAKQFEQFLDDGNYEGFDINPHFVEYCRQTYPRLNFTLCDVRHDEYNPTGKIDPLEFRFPFEDRSFDLVCAVAVFNHFETPWVFKYLAEISRILGINGIFFGTFLILNQLSLPKIEERHSHPFKFDWRTPDSWHEYTNRKLFNVAIPETGLRRQFLKCRLMIKEPIRYGEWCGSPAAITGHDVIVAIKGQWR